MTENRLQQLRINAGLSVCQLAAKAKITSAAIYAIEAGRTTTLRQRTIDRLSKALSVEPEDLFVSFRVIRHETPRPSATWKVIIVCPKCGQQFRLEVMEGEADPVEVVSCPSCGFSQAISLRRA